MSPNVARRIKRGSMPKIFQHDARGVSAVEFAMIAPIMVLFFFGMVELSHGVNASGKVTLTSRILSDLVAQATSVSTSDMTNVFAAATSIMVPFPVTTLQQKVSAVDIDPAGVAKIGWSKGSGTTGRTVGSTVIIPSALAVPGTQLIWSEVAYTYTPPTTAFLTGPINMTDQFFARPRQSSTVTGPPS